MSFTFLVIDLQNKVNLLELQNNIKQNYADYEIIYCSSKTTTNYDNVVPYCFDSNEDPEKIINSITKYCSKTNLVVVRDFTTFEDIKLQIKNLSLSNQIVYFKKELSLVRQFFWKILHFLIKLILFKDMALVNYGCVTYGEIATNILRKIENPSNLMRTNQWQGIQQVYVSGGRKYKLKYNIKKCLLQTLIPFALMIIGIVVFFVTKAKTDSLFKIINWFFIIICLIMSVVFGVNWFVKSQIGENNIEKSKI